MIKISALAKRLRAYDWFDLAQSIWIPTKNKDNELTH